ncbi:short-chain dehydrogenase/reductase SDR [Ilyonectria sp. MPI-CAGE-AT-0026]|nr:short-chain dehydrogenase/reductase SDR [Ilyonectria sp. MPI-CAGE-AT-0026]
MRFSGKVAFVTGGAGGIGFAVASRLVEEGANVVIGDIDGSAAKAAAAKIGGGAISREYNQADPASVREAIDFVVKEFGGLDFAVNCAAIGGPFASIADMNPEDTSAVVSINLTGTINCLKYELLAMKKRGAGAIVNIASTSGLRPNPFLGAYSATKAGIIAITQVAAVEEGPYGIRVNCISPGPIDTQMMHEKISREHIASITPNRRVGLPSDIANTAAYLLSDDAKHVVGTNIPVDGGILPSQGLEIPE